MDIDPVVKEKPPKASTKGSQIKQNVNRSMSTQPSATVYQDSVNANLMESKLTLQGGADVVPGTDVDKRTLFRSFFDKLPGQAQGSASRRGTNKAPMQFDKDRTETTSFKEGVCCPETFKDGWRNAYEMTKSLPANDAHLNAQGPLESPLAASKEKVKEKEPSGLRAEERNESEKMFQSLTNSSERSSAYSQACNQTSVTSPRQESTPEPENEELLNFAGSLPRSLKSSKVKRLSAGADQALEQYAALQGSSVPEVVSSLRDALGVSLDSDMRHIVQFVQSELQEMGGVDSFPQKTAERDRRHLGVQMPGVAESAGSSSSGHPGFPSHEENPEATEARGSRRLDPKGPKKSLFKDFQEAPHRPSASPGFSKQPASDEDKWNRHLESRRVENELSPLFLKSALFPMAKDGARPKCPQPPLAEKKASFTGLQILQPFPFVPGHEGNSSTRDEDRGSVFKPESIPQGSLQGLRLDTAAGQSAESRAPFSPCKEDMADDDNDDVISHLDGMETMTSPRHHQQALNPISPPPAALSISSPMASSTGASEASGYVNEKDSANEEDDRNGGEDGEGRRDDKDRLPDSGASGNCGNPGGGGDDDDNDDDDGDDNDGDGSDNRGDEKGGKKRKRKKKNHGENDSEEEDNDDEDMTTREKAETDQGVKRTKTDRSHTILPSSQQDLMHGITEDSSGTSQEAMTSTQLSEATCRSKEPSLPAGTSPGIPGKSSGKNLEEASWEMPTDASECYVSEAMLMGVDKLADMDLDDAICQRYSKTEKSANVCCSLEETMDEEFYGGTKTNEVQELTSKQAMERYPSALWETTSDSESHVLRGKVTRRSLFSSDGVEADMPRSHFGGGKSDIASAAISTSSNERMDDDMEPTALYSKAKEPSGSIFRDRQHVSSGKVSPVSKHGTAELFLSSKYTAGNVNSTEIGKFRFVKDVYDPGSFLAPQKEIPTKHCEDAQSAPAGSGRTEECRAGRRKNVSEEAAREDRTYSEKTRKVGEGSKIRSPFSGTASPKPRKPGILESIGLVMSPTSPSRRQKECKRNFKSTVQRKDVRTDTSTDEADISHLHAYEDYIATKQDQREDGSVSASPTAAVPSPPATNPGAALSPSAQVTLPCGDFNRGPRRVALANEERSSQRSHTEAQEDLSLGSVQSGSDLLRPAAAGMVFQALDELQQLLHRYSPWSKSCAVSDRAVRTVDMKRRIHPAELAQATLVELKPSYSLKERDERSQLVSELQGKDKSSLTRLAANMDTSSGAELTTVYVAEWEESYEEEEFDSKLVKLATFSEKASLLRDYKRDSSKNVVESESVSSSLKYEFLPKTETEKERARIVQPDNGREELLLTTSRRQTMSVVQPRSDSDWTFINSHPRFHAVEANRSVVRTRWSNHSSTENEADNAIARWAVTFKGEIPFGHRHTLALIPQMDGSADEANKDNKTIRLSGDSSEQTKKSASSRTQESRKDDPDKSGAKGPLQGKTKFPTVSTETKDTGRQSPAADRRKDQARSDPTKQMGISPDGSTCSINPAKLMQSSRLAMRRSDREGSDDTPPSSRYENVMNSDDSKSAASHRRRATSVPFELRKLHEMLNNVDLAGQNNPPAGNDAENPPRLLPVRVHSEGEMRTPPQSNKFLLVSQFWKEGNTSIEGRAPRKEEDMTEDPMKEYQALENATDIQRVKIHDWAPTPSHPKRPIPCPTIINSKAKPNPEWMDMPTPSRPSTRKISKILSSNCHRYEPYVACFNFLVGQERKSPQSTVRKSLKDQLDSEASTSSTSSSSSLSDNGGSDEGDGVYETQESNMVLPSYGLAEDAVFKKPNTEQYLKIKVRRQKNLKRVSLSSSLGISSVSWATSDPRISDKLATLEPLKINERILPIDLSGSPEPKRSTPAINFPHEDDSETLASPLPKSTDTGEACRQLVPRLLNTRETSSPRKGLLLVSAKPAIAPEPMGQSSKKVAENKTGQTPKLRQLTIDSVFTSLPSQTQIPSPTKTPFSATARQASTTPSNERKSSKKDKDAETKEQQTASPLKMLKKLLSPSKSQRKERDAKEMVKGERRKPSRENKENVPTASRNTREEPRQPQLTETGVRVLKSSVGMDSHKFGEKPPPGPRKRQHATGSSPGKSDRKVPRPDDFLEESAY